MKSRPVLMLLIVLLVAACTAYPTDEPTLDVDTIVQETFQALTPQAPGGISGRLGFPSEFIPPQRVVAIDVQTGEHYYIDTQLNQSTYQLDDLPEGTYHVVAYRLDSDYAYGAGYSQFVPCGLQVGCEDHSLIDVSVVAGQVTQNVDPIDWYATPGVFPTDPTRDLEILTGSISGNLSFPSEFIPAMRVVAFNVNTGQSYYVDTVDSQGTYQIDNLPTGIYHVVSYPLTNLDQSGGMGGGYTQAVPCGLTVACTDHSLIDVSVYPDTIISGINPGDWYAPAGTFPQPPVGP